MEDEAKPRREDYADTPQGLHQWALALRRYNDMVGIKSDDLLKQWDDSRRNAR